MSSSHNILIILLVLIVVGLLPIGPWWGPTGSQYGWYPSAGGIVLLVVLLFLFGVL